MGSANVTDTSLAFTESIWVKHTTNTDYQVISRLKGTSEFVFILGTSGNSGLAGNSLYMGFRGQTSTISTNSSLFINNNIDQWQHYVVEYNGGNKSSASSFVVYRNGVSITLGQFGNTIGGGANVNELGINEGGVGVMKGLLDEVRVASTTRSADWAVTEYNNQISTSTFYTLSGENNYLIPPSSGGSAIISYTVTSSPGGIASTSTGSPIVVTGLTNGTTYTFTVTATNAVGTGAASAASNAVVQAATPGSPTAVSPTAGNAQVSLSWSAPASNGGSAITDYVIEYKLTSEPTIWSTFSDGVSTGVSGTVINLTNGLSYDFRVSAVNAVGQGSASSPPVSSTPRTVPDAPTIGTATRGNTQATVTFTPPVSDGGSTITSYTVTSNPGSVASSSTASPIVVTGLTNGTAYTFTVTATNAAGVGSASSASNSVTPATTPDAPTSPFATAGNAQASVAFTAPVSNGGSAITSYTVTSSPGGFTGTGSVSPITVVGLSNGTVYTFSVTATNSVGVGTASVASNSITPIAVPGAPIIGTATRGNTQATVTFTPPVSDGGSAITGYTVTSSPGGFTGTGSASPITVTGLTNGTAYTFTVTADNAAGTGPASTASNSVTPATTPNAPTGLTPTAANQQVGLSWTAPAVNGGSAVTDYVIEFKLTSEPTTWSTFSDGVSAGTTGTVINLTNGLSYDFRVSAVNAVGQGSASAVATAEPLFVPDAPTIGTATAGNAQATVTFTPPVSDGGSPITGYTVTSSPGGITGSGSASPITVTGLTNGTAYTFTVTATNAAGTGAASAASNSVTPITVPGAPTSPSATPGNAEATVSFTPPASDGGSAITVYTVTSDPGGFTGTGSASPITVTGLNNAVAYTFTVTATNAAGTGPASAPSNSVDLATVPGAPANLAAVVLGSSISLSWSAPVSDGGSDITDYIIEYQLSTGGTWSVFSDATSINTTATVVDLSNDTSYDFRVRAVNIVGQSIPSGSVTVTPGEPAQVLIQSFPDLTNPTIGTAVRITNEGSIQYEYQYTWCVTDALGNLCGGGDDVFVSTAAKLIQPGDDWDTTLNSTVPTPGNYYFHIKVNYGSETSSAVQSFTAVATFPDPPTSPSAVPGNTQATVTFTAPVSNGGATITGYTVTSNPGGIAGSGSASPITVTGLTNGVAYTFTVTATNSVGTGASSATSNSVTPAMVPDAPTDVTAMAGNKTVTLSWVAPLNNGGSAITDYVIEYKLTSEPTTWSTFSDGISAGTTGIVTGLTNGLSYDFRISSVNAIGQSVVNTVSATLPATTQTVTSSSNGSSSGSRRTNTSVNPQIDGSTQTPGGVPTTPLTDTSGVKTDRTSQGNSQTVSPVNKPAEQITKIYKNQVTVTPTENPTIEKSTVGPLKWWILIILLILAILGGFAIFVRSRKSQRNNYI